MFQTSPSTGRLRRVVVAFSLIGATFLVGAGPIILSSSPASAAGCTATGFYRDSMNLTAAQINPTTTVTGTVDATGCNIGVYFSPGTTGSVSGALVENANYFGVVNNGSSVSVTNSAITNIGESPLNGDQHGVGIYFAFEGNSTGTISGNTVSNYQKGGIVVNGVGSSATISGNNVIGQGAVTYIAQNGIEVGYGATASIVGNTVTGNAYSGTNNASSCGILVFGGGWLGAFPYTTGVSVVHNTLTNNDIGVAFANLDANFNAPATPTQDKATNNVITDSQATNVSGNGYPNGYQVGVVDYGNKDSIVNNTISGNGYNQVYAPTTGSFYGRIDTSYASTNPHVIHNK